MQLSTFKLLLYITAIISGRNSRSRSHKVFLQVKLYTMVSITALSSSTHIILLSTVQGGEPDSIATMSPGEEGTTQSNHTVTKILTVLMQPVT